VSPFKFIKTRILAIGFGVEQIGILTLKAPILSCILLMAATFAGVYGASIMQVDDRISAFFESDREKYQNYQRFLEKFPTTEDNILLIFKSDKPLSGEQLDAIRWFQLDLGFEENIAGAYSVFSLRKPDGEGNSLPLIPDPIPEDESEIQEIWSRLQENGTTSSSLIGAQGKALLIILEFEKSDRDISHATVSRLQELAAEFKTDSGIDYELSGAPAIRYDISKTVHDDRIRFNIIGFIVGFFISFLIFRDVRFVLIASVPALLAAIWTIGVLGFLSTPMNMITTVIPAFVMVIAFADSTHLVYAIRRRIAKGYKGAEAAIEGVEVIGPACVLTSITTGIAVLSLTLTSSQLIQSFGWAAALGAFFALMSVLITVPVATALLFPNVIDYKIKKNSFEALLNKIADIIANFVLKFSTMITCFALVITVLSLLAFAFLDTNYRVMTHVPDNSQSKQGLVYLNEEFGGLHEVLAIAEMPTSINQDKDIGMQIAQDITSVFNADDRTAFATSITRLQGQEEALSQDDFIERFNKLPTRITDQLVSEDGRAITIRARFSLEEKQSISDYVTVMEDKLISVQEKYPNSKIYLSGTSVLTAESHPMLKELRNSLIGAFFVAIAVVGIAFRSIKMFLLSIVPNILPLSIAGVVLLLTGWHFEFSSAMALTVAFGIAVDDTIHMLHRLHRELAEKGKQTVDIIRDAAASTIRRVAPVIILATLIIVAGISIAGTSEMPTMRMFGGIASIVLVAALITDVIFLPAIVISLSKIRIIKDKFNAH